MTDAPQDQIAPILTPEGWELLASLGPYREDEAFRLTAALRKAGHSPELVSAVLTQSRLRTKAEAKFGEFARQMIFTKAGLEQATRLTVAARHAQRFAEAGIGHVADLGCGLGADAMALASLDLVVTAVEMDETTAACATMNLIPFRNATVVHADATSVPLEGVDGVWLDPARRTTSTSGTKRIWDPEDFSPPLSFVESLAGSGRAVGVKMGPGMPHDSVPAGCEAQWVSVGGDVTEVALWFNAVRRPGVRRAALVLGPAGCGRTHQRRGLRRPARRRPWGPWRGTCTSPTAPSSAPGWWPTSPSSWAGTSWTSTSPTSAPRTCATPRSPGPTRSWR